MINLNQVTLALMTSVNLERSIKAIEYSTKNINFKQVKLFTDKSINHKTIEIVPVPKMSSTDDYSYNVIYELPKHITTDYVLIIKEDGFIINPNLWQNEFLNYDYIGAPFPLPRDHFSYRDAKSNIFRVGNGGFSLRSKKLLNIPIKLNLPWKSFHGFYNEDGFICAMNRHIYEDNGCVFAPLDIAIKFSFEHSIENNINVKTFGFHGKHNFAYMSLLDDNK